MFCLCEVVCGQGYLSGISRGGSTFGGLGLQGQPYGYPERNILDDSCTEDGTVARKAIFEVGFKFEASEARKYSDSKASAVQR